MQNRYRILATAPVEVMDEEQTVTDKDWRSLDGRVFAGEGQSFVDEVSFGQEFLAGKASPSPLLTGGYLRLEYVEPERTVRAVIEFQSPRLLTEEECDGLVMELEVTLWDGLGDSLRWDNDLEWIAFGEVTIHQEPLPEISPGQSG